MNRYLYIVFSLIIIATHAQDSSKVNAKFNYLELSVGSQHNFSFYDDYVSGPFSFMPYPKFELNTPTFYHNAIAANIGLKLGRHKLTIGALYAPVLYGKYSTYSIYSFNNPFIQNLNFSANYFFYFNKKIKKANHFANLFFNTQGLKDYTNNKNDFEFKRTPILGLSYGITFYVKQKLLIEPSVFMKTNFMNNKDIYTYTSFTTITTKEQIDYFRTYHAGINLKIGYIINLKK